MLHITYDPEKNQRNMNERGLAFDDVVFFEFTTALIAEDDRKEYGEIRYSALGLLDGRVHALVLTLIPDGIRVISFRKANKREVQRYGTGK
ncbi:BrnT family toxin [Alishewanella longhuensis]